MVKVGKTQQKIWYMKKYGAWIDEWCKTSLRIASSNCKNMTGEK